MKSEGRKNVKRKRPSRSKKKLFEKTEYFTNPEGILQIEIAIMKTEILDEYLAEKIRSDKVVEGLLSDIRSEIERHTGAKAKGIVSGLAAKPNR